MTPDEYQALLETQRLLLAGVERLTHEVEALRAHVAAIEERLLMRPIPPQQLERDAPWRADEGLAADTARTGEVGALHAVVDPPGAAP